MKEKMNTLLPEYSHNCEPECLNLYNNKPVLIHPNKVTFVDAGIWIDIPVNCVLKVKNHLCNKPWRILNTYLYKSENSLIIPIITKYKCRINYGDILCHVQMPTVTEAYEEISGILYFYPY